MEIYSSTTVSSIATEWGTYPQTEVTGMSALDVLARVDVSKIGKPRALIGNPVAGFAEIGGPKVVVLNSQGHPVTAADIVRDSTALATTPATHQAWVAGMAKAVVHVLNDSLAHSDRIRSSDWQRAGAWWKQTVGTPVPTEVADAVRAALPETTIAVDSGLRLMATVATEPQRTSRVRGTALPGERTETRLRGTAFVQSADPRRRS